MQRRHLTFGAIALLTAAVAMWGVVAWGIDGGGWDPYLRWGTQRAVNASFLLSLVVVAALAVAPRWPAVALGGLWVALAAVVLGVAQPQAALVFAAAVGFACAAWGSRAVLWFSGASIVVASTVLTQIFDPFVLNNVIDATAVRTVLATLPWWAVQAMVAVIALLVLWTPWLMGLALRFRNRSVASEGQQAVAEAQRDHATEVAQAREQQAQLARDVHDVVGHSLTVILAQAEAAQYLRSEADVKASLDTIAATARASLEDVRRVLAATGPGEAVVDDIHRVLDAIRASGREVVFAQEGQPRPLPPDLATVAHRVLQEMLTNAVRHGEPSAPITVERHWGGDLRIEVANSVTEDGPVVPGAGSGVAGMRRRLDAVGGRLDVRQRREPPTHTVTAWIPLPGSYVASPATVPVAVRAQEVRRG